MLQLACQLSWTGSLAAELLVCRVLLTCIGGCGQCSCIGGCGQCSRCGHGTIPGAGHTHAAPRVGGSFLARGPLAARSLAGYIGSRCWYGACNHSTNTVSCRYKVCCAVPEQQMCFKPALQCRLVGTLWAVQACCTVAAQMPDTVTKSSDTHPGTACCHLLA